MNNHDPSDKQLLAEFLNGRQTALAALAERYERPLLGLARGLLGGRTDLACDAVQETWVRVIRFGRQFSGRSRFKTWVYRIAMNQCRDLRNPRHAAESGAANGDEHAAAANPSAALEARDEVARLRAVVKRLDPARREVVLLCYHAGLTHEQAAEILEIPLGTLKSRLHTALTELRERLGVEAPS